MAGALALAAMGACGKAEPAPVTMDASATSASASASAGAGAGAGASAGAGAGASAGAGAIPNDMLLVPGGTFTMGADKGGEEVERPAHPVTIASFLLDKTEVTRSSISTPNARFSR